MTLLKDWNGMLVAKAKHLNSRTSEETGQDPKYKSGRVWSRTASSRSDKG